MKVAIDLSDIETRALVSEGTYNVVVDSVELKEGERGPYFNWKLSIAEGEFEGANLWLVTSLSPRALFRLQEILVSYGFDSNYVGEWEVDEETGLVIEPEIAGQPGVITVEHEMYKGKPQARVTSLLGPNTPDEFPVAEKPAPATKAKSTSPFSKSGARTFK